MNAEQPHTSRRRGPLHPLVSVAFVLMMLLLAVPAAALEVPKLTGRVVDNAGMLSPEAESKLSAALGELENTDSTQVAVLTVPSLEGDSIEDFGIRVAEAWQIGQKGKDNGVILIVSKEDRKVRIEVGYGLEGSLTDVLAGTIIDNEITPRFKAGDFDGGIMAGVVSIYQAVQGQYKGTPKAKRSRKSGGPGFFLILPLIFIVAHFFTPRLGSRRSSLRREHGSGGSILPWLILGGMMGGGHGGRDDHFGGGGFGGGGFGGGFGGGGGGFGGGGASGGW